MTCHQCQGIETPFEDKRAQKDRAAYHKNGSAKSSRIRLRPSRLPGLDEVLPFAAYPLGLRTSSSSWSLACRVGLEGVPQRPWLD